MKIQSNIEVNYELMAIASLISRQNWRSFQWFVRYFALAVSFCLIIYIRWVWSDWHFEFMASVVIFRFILSLFEHVSSENVELSIEFFILMGSSMHEMATWNEVWRQ